MSETLLVKLKRLQHERGVKSPLSCHIEFQKWADQVYPLLSLDPKRQASFKQSIDNANHHNAFKMPTEIPINEAIGILNQAITSLEVMPIENTTIKPTSSVGNEEHNWHQNLLVIIFIGIITAVLSTMVISIFRNQLGISL